MKRLLQVVLAGGVGWLAAAGTLRAEGWVTVGDRLDDVYAVLGEPNGYIRSGSFALLYYDRGKVELQDDVVTSIELVSTAKARALKEEQERQAKELRERRLVEGTALQKQKLADPDFLSLPPAEQLSFWRTFRQRYPMVALDADAMARLAQQARQAQQVAQTQREAELQHELLRAKWRAMDAEERAREAELAARQAESRARYRSYSYFYPPRGVVYDGSSFSTTTGPLAFYGPSARSRITPVDPYRPLGGIPLSADANRFNYIPHWKSVKPGAFPNRAP